MGRAHLQVSRSRRAARCARARPERESLAVMLITAKFSMQPPLFGKAVSGCFYERLSSNGVGFNLRTLFRVPTNQPQGSHNRAGSKPSTLHRLFLSCIVTRPIPQLPRLLKRETIEAGNVRDGTNKTYPKPCDDLENRFRHYEAAWAAPSRNPHRPDSRNDASTSNDTFSTPRKPPQLANPP